QSSSTTLSSMDRMSVGGVNTVRGYRENQLIRDAGNIMNAELRVPVLQGGGSSLKLDLIPFYDRGSGKNQGEHSDVLSSAGLAGRASWNGLVFDLAVARRLKHPESVSGNGTLQDHSIHLQLSYSIF
ncbi:MAG: ShlB/FhaC/HecB family hemolysin secretion/activation protein, partial [Pseudomonadota bacterium]